MPDLEEVLRLRHEVAHLRTRVKALEGKYAHGQATSALLLRTACGYRDAHAAVQQDVRMLPQGKPLTGFGQDEAGARTRTRALRSAQCILFVVADVIQEEEGRTLGTEDTPPE